MAALSTPGTRPRPRPRYWRGIVAVIAVLYFLGPLAASVLFTVDVPGQGFTLSAYTGILGADGFLSSLRLTLELAVATIAVVLLLLVPAMIATRLSLPRLRTTLEILCSLPLVVPAVALTAGFVSVLSWGPTKLARTPFYETILQIQNPSFPVVLVLVYVLMALPLAYRTLDAGLRALDLTTLVEAARNCGASPATAVFRVVLPNLRGALLNTAFLTLALVLGEYTAASILGFTPFAVWIVGIGGSQAQMSVAVSVLSLVLTWVLLLILAAAGRGGGTSRTRRISRISRKNSGKQETTS